MGAYMMIAFFMFTGLYLLTSTTLKNLELSEKHLQVKYEESQRYQKGVEDVISARNNFVKVYRRYPSSVNELISVGFLPSSFSTSEYGRDISLSSNGLITVSNRDIGNGLKNVLLESNKEVLTTTKTIANTETLVEQQKRFNALKSNEKSITIGNNPTLSKDSTDYVKPNLTGTTTNSLQGW